MRACLHIVGLGPAGLEKMTVGNYRLLLKAKKVFVRTLNHPCAQELLAEGVVFESFDEFYDTENSFEDVYEKIAQRLLSEVGLNQEVVYAVPGHPTVAEKSVQLVGERLSGQAEVIIHPAVSFLDEVFCAIPFDPIEGLLVRDYDELRDTGLTGKEWLVIPQVYSKMVASEVKLDLMEFYPEDSGVFVVQALGTAEERVQKVLLYEMDHQEFGHMATVVVPPNEEVPSLPKLAKIMEKLRSPDGCPWDREQTHESLKPYLIEESYEVLEAIENQDMYNLCEELGDLLLQVVFHAQVGHEAGDFVLNDVLKGIIAKLIRRHPHVFGTEKVETASEVVRSWEQIKKAEKSGDEVLNYFNFPKGLPALMLAESTQKSVAKVGFDWPDAEGPMGKVQEELFELQDAMASGIGVREELGDLLFAVVNLARFLDANPEASLRDAVRKFQARFLKMAELATGEGYDLEKLTLAEMDLFWERAKTQEKSGKIH